MVSGLVTEILGKLLARLILIIALAYPVSVLSQKIYPLDYIQSAYLLGIAYIVRLVASKYD
jgi:hypothetical protein